MHRYAMSRPFVTILIPVRNEELAISACLTSLLGQDYPYECMEILVIDGESTDTTLAQVYQLANSDPRIVIKANPHIIQAAALNLGIRCARGSIIVRADAHATYGPAYISTCVDHLESGRAENVGGVQRAVGDTPLTSAIASAMNSILGSGNARYRTGTEQQYTDTVWLGAWRRSTLEGIGGFNEQLTANEDYELNWRLRAMHGRILLDPALPCSYFPRKSFIGLCRQYFRYGTGKSQMLRMYPNSVQPRQMVAPMLVLGLACTVCLIPFSYLPFLLVAGGYLACILIGGSLISRVGRWRQFLYLPTVFAAMHLSWGTGFLTGIIRQSLEAAGREKRTLTPISSPR